MIKDFLKAWRLVRARRQLKGEAISIDCDSDRPRVAQANGLRVSDSTSNVTIHKAVNGRILEIASFRPNPHGPDWTYEHYIIADGEDIVPTLSTILLMKGMK